MWRGVSGWEGCARVRVARQPGLYFQAAAEVFKMKADRGYADMGVWVSFFEIYGGKLYDLLNDRRKLVARADAKQARPAPSGRAGCVVGGVGWGGGAAVRSKRRSGRRGLPGWPRAS